METSSSVIQKLSDWADQKPDILLCILFGSLAHQQGDAGSDLDIAVAKEAQLSVSPKQDLIEELAVLLGRPVDLVDLQITSGTLLHQVLTTGKLIYCRDHHLYADIIKKCCLTSMI